MPLADASQQASHGTAPNVTGILLLYLPKRGAWAASGGLSKLIGSRVNLRWVLGRSRESSKGLLVGWRLSLTSILALLKRPLTNFIEVQTLRCWRCLTSTEDVGIV